MNKESDKQHHINPKVRAYGKARIDIARRARTRQDWDRLWKRPQFGFPFQWGQHWKHCIEYSVDDFAAEVGFFIDVLGLPVNAFNPDYAMFTSPDLEFFFAVTPAAEGSYSTPPDAIRLQFMVADIFETTRLLEERGILFEKFPEPCTEGSLQYVASFPTPHGIAVDLWGVLDPEAQSDGVEISPSEDMRTSQADHQPVSSPVIRPVQAKPVSPGTAGTRSHQEPAVPARESAVKPLIKPPAWKAIAPLENDFEDSGIDDSDDDEETSAEDYSSEVEADGSMDLSYGESSGEDVNMMQGVQYVNIDEPEDKQEYHYRPISLLKSPQPPQVKRYSSD